MQNSTRHSKEHKPRLNPSEHKELVKISGGRTIDILVSKKGSIETRIIDLVKKRN